MEKIQQLKQQAIDFIESAKQVEEVNQIRIEYLGKKGHVANLMNLMKELPNEEKPKLGAKVNELKQELTARIDEKMMILKQQAMLENLEKEKIDITLQGYQSTLGTIHPLTMITQEIEDLFLGMGYQVAEGPEIELDIYNFEKANTPKNHPARDMQDTFYINPEVLLRTHTTAIQMRELEKANGKLPIKLICPGKVYRRDDDDATHSHQFMQAEGLVVGKNITLSDLKGTLQYMANHLFGQGRTIRFRPSYFPFTEPSVEVDVSCHICNGQGCNVCKSTGFIEVLGAGMVHPNVLKANGFDPEVCSGFAFGIGLERVAMLKYGIDDIRNFYINDIRFLKMFHRFD
ncbi:phenylalanine--tRNA ligase subunit alpha [Erysipelotrichaceae bacterium OH741_COT-311]|nr:phenylalanine--tRNA ligase subunit alpha [Erysipelotrichaceae bacterium OH741_COT-311]